jgi:DNA-directed RNA polymerase specialized sigma24 family protein
MDDCDIVAAIAAGGVGGIARAYDKYAASLYGYCHWMVPEPSDAAVALQDTFIIAATRLAVLRDPRKLRPWLYAVARAECRRWLDRAPRTPRNPRTPRDPGAPRDLGDQNGDEVAELNLKHHLAGRELAAVLGVSRNRAHALVARARDGLERSLGTPLDRAVRSGLARPAALPRVLRDEVLRMCTEDTPEALAYREWVTRRAGPFGAGGFPRSARRPVRMFPVTGAAAAAGIVVAIASAGIVMALTLSGTRQPPRSLDAARAGGPAAARIGAGRSVGTTRTPRVAATSLAPASAAPGPGGSQLAGGGPPSAVASVSLVTTVPSWSGPTGPATSPSASPSVSPTAAPATPAPPTPSPTLDWPPPSPAQTGFP